MIFLKESSESNSQVYSYYDPNEEIFYALKKHNRLDKYLKERKILEYLNEKEVTVHAKAYFNDENDNFIWR